MTESETKLPFGLCICITSIVLTENIILNLISPILPFMVEFYLRNETEDSATEYKISEYTGYLEGSFRMMQFFGSLIWSILSDRIGRKYVLIIGLCFHIVSSFLLGFCTTFNTALIMRMFSGFGSANIPVTKSLIREVTTDMNVSKLYGYFSLGIGIGNVVGPLLGGLSDPYRQIGGVFESTLFRSYPYLLPLVIQYNLFSSIAAFISLILILLYIPKPKPQKKVQVSIINLKDNKLYIYSLVVYGFIAIPYLSSRLVFSLFSKSLESLGGFGIKSESTVSFIQGLSGIYMLILPPLLTPIISNKIGLVNSLLVLSISAIPVSICIPYLRIFDAPFRYIAIVSLYGLSNSIMSMSVLYISICISNTVTSEVLGAANGLSQSFMAICRFLSAIMSGFIYGWSVSSGFSLPGINASFCYYIICGFLLIQAFFIFVFLDKSIEKKKKTDDTDESKELYLPLIKNNPDLKT